MQRISDTHDKSKSVVDELAGAYRSLQEEKRHLTAERKALEEEIRREMSLVDSDTVSLPLQEEYEKLTEAFKGTFEVIDTFRKTSEVQAAEILEILRQRKTGQTLQLDMTGLVSDASTCSDMPEAIQVCSGLQLPKLLLKAIFSASFSRISSVIFSVFGFYSGFCCFGFPYGHGMAKARLR